jgi:hypothetical protein
MSELLAIVLLILAGMAASMLIGTPVKRPRFHAIDTVDLMRLHDARKAGFRGRPRLARWVILAIVAGSLAWGLLG